MTELISKLLKSSTSKDDFSNAVRWCGVNGDVSRTVKKENYIDFANYLYNLYGFKKTLAEK